MIEATGAIARALVEALHPLRDALADPAALQQLLLDLGYEVEVTDAALAALEAPGQVAGLVDQGEALVAGFDDLVSTGGSLTELAGAISDLVALGEDLLVAVDDLRHAADQAPGPPLDDPAVWADAAAALPGHLLVTYLEEQAPVVYGLLRFCGVIHDAVSPGGGEREVFSAQALVDLAGDPLGTVSGHYAWGEPGGMRHREFLAELDALLSALGLRVRIAPVRDELARLVWSGDATTADGRVRELAVTLTAGPVGAGYAETALVVVPVPDETGERAEGLYVTTIATGNASATITPTAGWTVDLTGGMDGVGVVGLRLTSEGASLIGSSLASSSVTVAVSGAPAEPWSLLGGLLELAGVDLDAALLGPTEAELALTVAPVGMRVVLDPGGGDSFLRHLLGSDALVLPVDATIRWSSRDGLTVSGHVGLDVVLPLTLRLGGVVVDGLHLVVSTAGVAAQIQADVGVVAEIGPVVATVQGIGVALALTEADDGRGALGPMGAAVAFVPPTGIGVAIVSDIASGGGYIESDRAAGRYAGVLDVEILGVGITAVGILSTSLPTDPDGWALFFSLSATFTGLQLGFGFTLNGVGGLIGLHRGVDPVALGDGIRAGSLDSVLFPTDPIARAGQILEDIEAIFPVQQGQYVFGPVVVIGWGTPTVMTAELGVVIELPDPVTISLLGSFSAILPEPETAILALTIDVAGTLDLTNGSISVDASLRDSHVAGIALTGDMAMRAELLAQPSFLLSFGGFNPHFDPPGSFPDLRRLAVSLDTGDTLRVGLWGYFALTSNTVQFGAGAELWASVAGLTVEGAMSFDALIMFDPFGFDFQLGFLVDVRAGRVELFGVHLDLRVLGPNPFHFVGSASMKILGIRTSFSVDETIGARETEAPLPVIDVLGLLVAALEEASAWRAVPPGEATPVVLAEGEGVHPAGALEVVQRIVPLRTTIERYGNAGIDDVDHFQLTGATIGDAPVPGTRDVDDWFAVSQYQHLTDDERLSAPSFELLGAGLRMEGAPPRAGTPRAFVRTYEQVIRDPDLTALDRTAQTVHTLTPADLDTSVRFTASPSSPPRVGLHTQAGPTAGSPYALRPVAWVATDAESGAVADAADTGARQSWSQARASLAASPDAAHLVLAPVHERTGS